MKALSLFTGIMGIDIACEWAGIETVAMCERDAFCQKVIRKHKPDIPLYDDVCTLTKERLDADGIGAIDIIHGGYPCQPFSHAGKREGTEDHRHLWPEVFRLIQAIQPKWFVGENVAGHITLGLDIVLTDLESIGYTWETFVLPASSVNARHRRDRVFIVAHSYGKGMEGWKETGDIESIWKKSIKQPLRYGNTQTNVAHSYSEPRLEASEEVSSIRSGRESWNHVSWSGGRYISGTDWWATEPSVGRVANGVPNRVDRLKALGNAVVPQQIYPILAAIKQIDDMLGG